MTPEEKKPYEDRAANDRDRYKGEMNNYQSNAMMKQVNAATGGQASHLQVQQLQQQMQQQQVEEWDQSHLF